MSEPTTTTTPAKTGQGVAVRLTDLRRTYSGVNALDGMSLDMAPGEFVALLGPSGCGKTTALRCLAGLEDPDSGTITVGGKDVTAIPTSKRDMGMVFQAYSLFPHMTARENVEFGLQLRRQKSDQRRRRAEEMLELVGLTQHIDKYAHQMSGGQQQRVALARALAIEPQVLLLDEPLSALDAKVRVQLRDEIRRIQLDVGTTTLFVTHDQEEALAIADRVGVMRAGQLQQIAAPEQLYSSPVNDFVADFVGVTNRLAGTASGGSASVLGGSVALLPGSAGPGPVVVLVRPEHVTVAREESGNGSVISASFLGAHGRVIAESDTGEQVTVQVSSAAVGEFAPGARVRLVATGEPALAVAG
ncbi:MAG: ABC transporter ATP-binding protein [Humibacillus sp.]|nr:ABC transporter ATP-binding protein [Humibacillus sp.]MDN5778032.1 ABC transporter ATP-binding protein [Humibacillus sp.]